MVCSGVQLWVCFLYLLILSDSLLLLLDSSEFQCIRSVSSWDDIVLRPVCAADLTARPCGFVYVSARRARPTLWHRVVLLISAFSWDESFSLCLSSEHILFLTMWAYKKAPELMYFTCVEAELGLIASLSWGISRLMRSLISLMFPLSGPPETFKGK